MPRLMSMKLRREIMALGMVNDIYERGGLLVFETTNGSGNATVRARSLGGRLVWVDTETLWPPGDAEDDDDNPDEYAYAAAYAGRADVRRKVREYGPNATRERSS